MPSPYQVFAQKARERFEKKRQAMALGKGGYRFTLHSQHKMRQYGLSEQRVRSVIRNPQRREVGIVPRTVAVMQPVSVKRGADGKESWKQEIWVMFVVKNQESLPVRQAGGIRSGDRKKGWGNSRFAILYNSSCIL